ncbi:hypothetical protein NDU88_000944 [Pleurodeles waltl]|uniref:Uncharacterized protein n=1 Tax=Pleurodeles waltl TaxID=8319 RepID=A0AAV7NEB1_PLEWA|nr:hypothetical protein NDU88_000944 [Pleurodeles waltl]
MLGAMHQQAVGDLQPVEGGAHLVNFGLPHLTVVHHVGLQQLPQAQAQLEGAVKGAGAAARGTGQHGLELVLGELGHVLGAEPGLGQALARPVQQLRGLTHSLRVRAPAGKWQGPRLTLQQHPPLPACREPSSRMPQNPQFSCSATGRRRAARAADAAEPRVGSTSTAAWPA